MKKKREITFVSDDKWLREKGGRLDVTDRQIIGEAALSGRYRVKVMTLREMLESLKKTEPEKFEELMDEFEKSHARRMTLEDLLELSRKGNTRLSEFTGIVASMNLGQATQIRHWRVKGHLTWRSLARAAYREGWFDHQWEPPANQIMGMALAERAAIMFGENYREEPWN
jgi:hypothetical protein